jgi:hypothetical protein
VPGSFEVSENTLGCSNVEGARGRVKSAQHTHCMGEVWPGPVDQVEEGANHLHVWEDCFRDNRVKFILVFFCEFDIWVEGEGPRVHILHVHFFHECLGKFGLGEEDATGGGVFSDLHA